MSKISKLLEEFERLSKFNSFKEDYDIHVIEVEDGYLYYLFGENGNGEVMEIDNESLEYLEDYLLETDEDNESKMDDKSVKELFEKIKKSLKAYNKVCVRLKSKKV